MLEQNQPQKVTCTCPAGHRIRASLAMIGESVSCPRCDVQFVFGQSNDSVSDSVVMRILGDGPQESPEQEQQSQSSVPASRPCARCGVGVSESASVCQCCNSYVGAFPTFMHRIQAGQISNN